jgi:hypothetical protein
MSDTRTELIRQIEKIRESRVITYVTGDRPNLSMQIGSDTPRLFYDHLADIQERIPRLDLYLYSSGGDSSVPWRLVSLFREFAEEFNVLVPYRAYSAATMIALGADSIVMGRKAELGPIDPTVSNEFNPVDANTKRRLGISVEDVTSYINLIRDKVGLVHQPEVAQAFDSLAKQVHPLALGYVNRHYSFIRMVASKLLSSHVNPPPESESEEIVRNLVERIYFHGHGIARKEAKNLKLNVVEPQSELEDLMWKLYLQYENELQLTKIFNPEDILDAMGADEHVLRNLAGAFIESQLHSHVFRVDVKLRVQRAVPPNVSLSVNVQAPQPQQPTQQVIQQLQQAIQQIVRQQLAQQSPVVGFEMRLANTRWERTR